MRGHASRHNCAGRCAPPTIFPGTSVRICASSTRHLNITLLSAWPQHPLALGLKLRQREFLRHEAQAELPPADDGALAPDGPAHALELPGMGIAAGLAAELLAALPCHLLKDCNHGKIGLSCRPFNLRSKDGVPAGGMQVPAILSATYATIFTCAETRAANRPGLIQNDRHLPAILGSLSVLPRFDPGPFSERPVKCTGLGKSKCFSDISQALLSVAQKLDRQIAAQIIQDSLVSDAFVAQATAQRGLRDM